MSVWKRVRQNASESADSIIHGKAEHEETKATSSRALRRRQAAITSSSSRSRRPITSAITSGTAATSRSSSSKFSGAYSPGFDPDLHLQRVGVANQTTMMRGETEEVQRRIQPGDHATATAPSCAEQNFRFFDTICGATQERQDALREMLDAKMDLLLVVGGYNSSNTSHLAEMGEAKLPTYFIRNAAAWSRRPRSCITTCTRSSEVVARDWLPARPARGRHHCRRVLPEQSDRRNAHSLFELRGISRRAAGGLASSESA